jgi:MFS family permease
MVQDVERPRLWTKDFVIVSIINFLSSLVFYLLMVVISGYAMNRLHSSPGVAGFSASIFVIGALVARLFIGQWIGRVGQKKALYMGLILGLPVTVLYLAVNSVMFLCIVRFLHGVAFGVASTTTGTIVANLVPKERSGEGIGYYGLSTTVATAMGPFFGMFISQHGSFSMIFAVCSSAAAISLVIAPFLVVHDMGLTEEQMKKMRGFRFGNVFESKVIPISIVCMVVYFCYSSVVSFLAVYARGIDLADAADVFFIVSAAVVLVTRPVVGRLFDLRGENSIMYTAISALCIGMIVLSQTYYGFTLLVAGAVIGLGFGAAQACGQTVAVKYTPSHRMGLANSTFFMFLDMGMGSGPVVAGLVIPLTGYRGMYMGVAVVAGASVLLYYLLHGRMARVVGKVPLQETDVP